MRAPALSSPRHTDVAPAAGRCVTVSPNGSGAFALPLDESAAFTPPAAFGPFRVLHQIGSGVLGPVFRTYDPQQDRLVAVKAFRLDIVPEDVAKLADALRKLAAAPVTHASLVAPVDAGLEGMAAFLAMEYVSAETLDVALRHLAPAKLERVLPLVRDIAGAVEAAWAAGVGHGALHPRDVFIATGETGTDVRITGFGVVSAIESAGIAIAPRRPYAAPERGHGPWDIRADVYSLGVIAHELLTKRRPAGPREQDGSLATGTTPEERVLIRRVLAGALAERPDHRFATPSAFVRALDAIVKGEPLGELPEGATIAEPREEPVPIVPAAPLFAALEREPDPPPPGTMPLAREVSATPTPPPESFLRKGPSRPAEAPVVPAPAPSTTEAHQDMSRPAAALVPEPVAAPPAPTPTAPAPPPQVSTSPRVDRITPPTLTPPPVVRVPHLVPVDTRPAFPWAAIAAASIAGLFLGGVGGYAIGRAHAVPAPEAATIPSPAPGAAAAGGTDVSVPPTSSSGLAVTTVPSTPVPVSEPASETPAPKPLAPPAAPIEHARAAVPAESTASSAKPKTEATTGSAVIDTRPSGAKVYVDDRLAGETPLTMPSVRPGTHLLRLELKGYRTVTSTLVIKAGARERVAVTLELTGIFQAPPPGARR